MMKKYLLSSVFRDGENEQGTPEEIAAKKAAAAGNEGDGRENVFQERIGELTRKRGEAERRAEAAEARVAEAERRTRAAEDLLAAGKTKTPEEIAAEAAARGPVRAVVAEPSIDELLERPEVKKRISDAASARRSAEDITARGDALYDEGAKEFSEPKWDKALKSFQAFDGLREDVTRALLNVPNGHRVLYHLGSNVAEIARIYKLADKDPIAMAVEIAKLSGKIPAPKKVSDAPEPPDHSDGGRAGGGSKDYTNPDLPMSEFVAQRDADLKKRGVRL